MPVNYTPPAADQLLAVPGVSLGTATAGIKAWERDDVVLVALDPGSHAAGVFTQNRFAAAPVEVCREHLGLQTAARALLINAGNANAGNGRQGVADARETCVAVANLLKCDPREVLPFSTGVIMEPLPVAKIVGSLPQCHASLSASGWHSAARALMTTDTVPKGASRRVDLDAAGVTVTGIAKGAGMMSPNMATMLGFIATDAPIAGRLLPGLAASAADASFNRITIDGDTSTNDSFVLIASGKARMDLIGREDDPRLALVREAVHAVAVELAQAIVRDGEGATKFIEITVEGGRDVRECDHVARAIANSPLVKTAFFASDPNLGRIVCAIGNGGITDLDTALVSFWLDKVLVVAEGGRAPSYREEDGRRVMAEPEIAVRVALGRGGASSTVWTCDLSHEYVSINADYRS
jgi:glutamate N-acetyltransferase/amino-acid N-acetyltransferase